MLCTCLPYALESHDVRKLCRCVCVCVCVRARARGAASCMCVYVRERSMLRASQLVDPSLRESMLSLFHFPFAPAD